EQDAAGAVVDLGAITGILIIVGAMGIAVEVAQVGAQLAATEGDVMHSTHIMLAIVVFQFAKVVAGGQVVGHLVVSADKAELIDPFGTAGDAQFLIVAGCTALGLLDLAGDQAQAIYIGGAQLAAAEGLWQQATIVQRQYRQLG